MTFGASVGFLLALLLVLGLFGLAMRAARRFAGLGGGPRARLPLAVLQRVAVGPRQGLAVVRIGERTLVVSVGDGGVRPVTQLTAEEGALFGVGEAVAQPHAAGVGDLESAGTPGFASLLAGAVTRALTVPLSAARPTRRGIFRAVRSLMIAALPLLLVASAASAQTTQTQQPSAEAVLGVAAGAAQQLTGGTAPRINLQVGDGKGSDLRLSGTVGTVLFLGLLSMLPTLLLLMTSFTRVLVVLHFLRQALGTQNAPPAHLLAALALLLTGFIMAPTLTEVNTTAVQPWMNGLIDEGEMMSAGIAPFRAFMLANTSEEDLARFVEMSGQELPETPEEVSLPVLMTAFATHELKAAFQMGFALFLPFVIIDLVVSAVLTSMGMFMLPPTMIALPCKLLLFVLVDGWSLIVGSLIASFR